MVRWPCVVKWWEADRYYWWITGKIPLARWKRVKIIMSDIENSLQMKLCYHELSTLWCSFAVQVEYGWTDRCKSTDTTSQKVINWQQSYETDTSMYLKMRMSTLTPHSSYIVFGLQSRPAVSFTHTWVCTTNQWNLTFSIFGNSCLSYTISSS